MDILSITPPTATLPLPQVAATLAAAAQPIAPTTGASDGRGTDTSTSQQQQGSIEALAAPTLSRASVHGSSSLPYLVDVDQQPLGTRHTWPAWKSGPTGQNDTVGLVASIPSPTLSSGHSLDCTAIGQPGQPEQDRSLTDEDQEIME